MTSLYQATFAKTPVRTRTPKGMEIERFYYLDIKLAVSRGTLDEAIVGVPADRIVRTNSSKAGSRPFHKGSRIRARLFPLNQVFDSRNWYS